jgi:hypothetical protein
MWNSHNRISTKSFLVEIDILCGEKITSGDESSINNNKFYDLEPESKTRLVETFRVGFRPPVVHLSQNYSRPSKAIIFIL